MLTLAIIPPQALLLGAALLVLSGFLLYRKLMRTGKGRRMFDMEEDSQNVSEILGDISEGERKLVDRGTDLSRTKRQLNKELNQIKKHTNE